MILLCIDEILVESKSELRNDRVLPKLALSAAKSYNNNEKINNAL